MTPEIDPEVLDAIVLANARILAKREMDRRAMTIVRHCPDPDCDGVLEREPFNFYCRTCQQSYSDAQVTQGDTDD